MSTNDGITPSYSLDDEIRRILAGFEQAWEGGQTPPDVREVFHAHQRLGLPLLRQLVVLNYDLAWDAFHAGEVSPTGAAPEPRPAKIYRRAFPELDGDGALLLELLLLEIINWDNPDESYYVQNYPQFESNLRAIFDLLKLFKPEQLRTWASSVSKSARAQTTGERALLVNQDHPEERSVEPQSPLPNDLTIALTDSCRIVGETIGEGAFKRVYQGIQTSTGRAVAVKQLMRVSERNVRNFVSEGRAQAGLDHQNIPPIILLGDQDGKPTLLLEKLIRAPDWSTTIHERGMRARNLDILLTVSRAAEYAHRECSLVHRDIKPQNVLVGEYREVYLVDWGLAVQVGDQSKLHESVRRLKDEPDSFIIGPPGYMAPEMALGRNHACTPATDVFMLGAILYEILTGHPPYDAYPRSACFRAAAHFFPELPADIPEELKAITLKAMARDPAERFQDAGYFAEALERYLSHREAENQSHRAESALQELNEALGVPVEKRRPTPELLTSLIAVADQFRQAGDLWWSSLKEKPTEGRDSPVIAAEQGALSNLERFTISGVTRSQQGECQAREKLVSFAVEAGDLALAESQAHVLSQLNSPRAAELNGLVQRALRQRTRDRRQRLAAATAALLLFVIAMVFWQQRTTANLRADKLESEKFAAEADKQAAEADKIAAEEREKRLAAEKLAEERERRLAEEREAEILRANTAEVKRLDSFAIQAESVDFHPATVLYRAATLPKLPASNPRIILDIQDRLQTSLVPIKTTSRRCPTSVVHVSPDGKWLASGDLFGAKVRIWSTDRWTQTFVLEGHQQPKERPGGGIWGTIRALVFDPRHHHVLYSAGLDGTVRAWDLNTRVEVRRFTPAKSIVQSLLGTSLTGDELLSLAVRPPQEQETKLEIAIGNLRGEIVLLDADQLTPIKKVKAHKKQVNALSYALDGSRLATASLDGTAKVWTKDLEEVTTISHPEKGANGKSPELLNIAFSPDGKHLAACGDAVTIPLWETTTWSIVHSLAGHPKSEDGYNKIYDLLWISDHHLISAASDGVIRRWNPDTGEAFGELRGHTPNMFGRRGVLSVTEATRDQLVSVGRDCAIRVWDLATNRLLHSLEGTDLEENPKTTFRAPMHVAYAAKTDQLFAVSSSLYSYVHRWDPKTLREIPGTYQFPELQDGAESDPQGLAISPDGSQFVVSFLTGQLGFWKTDQEQPAKLIKAHTIRQAPDAAPPFRALSVAYSPDGTQVASLANDGMLRLWDANSHELIREWALTDAEFPVGSSLSPAELSKLSEEQRKMFAERDQLSQTDFGLLFIGDNRLLTAGRDNLVRCWNTDPGEIVQRIDLGSEIESLAFDSSSNLLAIGGKTGDVWIGDISDLKKVRFRTFLSLKPLMVASRFGRAPRLEVQRRDFGGSLQNTWAAHVHSLAFSPGGTLLAVTLGDGSLALIDISTGGAEILGRAIGHTNPREFYQSVRAMFSPEGRLLTIGDDRIIREWDFNYWKVGRTELTQSANLAGGYKVVAAADGKEWIYAAGGSLARWSNTEATEPTTWAPAPQDLISSIAVIPSSDDLLIGTNGGQAIRFDRTKNSPVFSFPPDEDASNDISERRVAVSSDGRMAALSRRSGAVEIWNLADRIQVCTIPAPRTHADYKLIEAIAFHPHGSQLAVTDIAGTIRVWDLTKPEITPLIFEAVGPQQAMGLKYLPDGSRLVTAGMTQNSESIVVWETKSFRKVRSLDSHRPVRSFIRSTSSGIANSLGSGLATVKDIDISSDGQWLASCGTDATVRIWRLAIDAANPEQDRYEPFAVLSTLDLERITRPLSLQKDDTRTGVRQSTWASSVAFQSDNRKLAVSSEQGPVVVFDFEVIKREFSKSPQEILDDASQQLGVELADDRLKTRDPLFLESSIDTKE
jgi:WD40 repeat protein/serine/threonine protein kinase